MSVWKAVSYFAGGILTGSAGFSILGSKDAKKAYILINDRIDRGADRNAAHLFK